MLPKYDDGATPEGLQSAYRVSQSKNNNPFTIYEITVSPSELLMYAEDKSREFLVPPEASPKLHDERYIQKSLAYALRDLEKGDSIILLPEAPEKQDSAVRSRLEKHHALHRGIEKKVTAIDKLPDGSKLVRF